MLLDKQNEFSDSQAITVTAISTNVIDTLPSGVLQPNTVQNLGGTPGGAYLVVQVDEAFAGTAGTVTITLESDSTANLATSPTVHLSTGAIGQAALTAGAQVAILALPQGAYEKYLGLRYTVGGTITAGKLSAFLTRDIQTWRPYAVGAASNL